MTTPDFVNVPATIKSIGEPDEFPGRFEVIASTKALDRDGESMRPGALTLPPSAPFYVDHDWKDGALPVGRGVPEYEGDLMKAVGTYASSPRAQEIRALVNEGIIDSCSVGFLNGKRETSKGIREVVSGDLFEISFTAIPINPEARILASKALGGHREPERTTKAIEGSYEALRERLCDALEDAYGEYCCWIRGVLPTVVVFDCGGDTYQQTYTDDGTVATLTGTRSEVDIHEVVVPDPDAATEPPEGDSSGDASMLSLRDSDGAADPAAKAAGDAVTDEAKQAQARLLFRAATA